MSAENEPKSSDGSGVKPIPAELSNVGAQAKTAKTKFAVLKTLIDAVEVSDRDILDTIFNLLVGGEFDLEVNFIIHDDNCIIYLLDIMSSCSIQCQAEIWSKFKGICRKSYRNLQACVEIGLVQRLLNILPDADEVISELLVDMLSLLTSYNISVKELKQLLSMLKGDNGKWPPYAVKLLGVLQATTERHGPDCFFSFPGKRDAAIALPPLKTWPYANGFTFTTWFRMDPLNSLRVDMDKPYLYCFRNNKGMGYSGHFVGSCFIVTVLKSKGKGFQHCLKFDFKPRKWYMVTIVHIYNRWRSSELKCYANGQLVSYSEMNWSMGGNDQYDKCFLGSAETGDDSRVFCGQMTASYVFSEAISASQVYALYQLGPGYKNQFKFPTESDHLLANHHRKVLYEDNKLSDAIVLAYNPKSTDGQLCLECSPRTHNRDGSTEAQRWFVHSPHALMLPDVKAVVTHSIHSALHSVGGAEVLFPLFAQLDYKQRDGTVETTVCATLLNFFLQLLQGSVKTQQQVVQGKGFLVIGTLLERAHRDHISMDVLNALISTAKFLDQLPNGMPLMRQFCDQILFNPALWIHTNTKVQICLYTYLATEFVSSPTIQTNLRRVSTVLLLIHALKHYYWVINPQPRSGIVPKGLDGPRPTKDEILSLRAFILLFLKQLVTRTGSILEDELQSILGYLLTIHEDENVLDVLQLLVAMLSEHGSTVTPVFDRQNGLAVVFKLLGSRSELVRIHSLKLLAYFLKQCSDKRKSEIMDSQSLFMLVGERLLLYPDEIGISTYNAMYEVLVENPCTQVLHKAHQEPTPGTFIHNPAMMKVTANMIRQCPAAKIQEVKLLFLNDLLKLFQANRENRRILLQQSVWQDWMLAMGYLRPQTEEESQCQELVYQLFRVLLYHAIKLEWGGWRVWVDTLAIVHSKVSYEEHKSYLERMYEEYKQQEERNKATGQVSAITGMQEASHDAASEEKLAITEGDIPHDDPVNGDNDAEVEGGAGVLDDTPVDGVDHLEGVAQNEGGEGSAVKLDDQEDPAPSEEAGRQEESIQEEGEVDEEADRIKKDAQTDDVKEEIGDYSEKSDQNENENTKEVSEDEERVPEDVAKDSSDVGGDEGSTIAEAQAPEEAAESQDSDEDKESNEIAEETEVSEDTTANVEESEELKDKEESEDVDQYEEARDEPDESFTPVETEEVPDKEGIELESNDSAEDEVHEDSETLKVEELKEDHEEHDAQSRDEDGKEETAEVASEKTDDDVEQPTEVEASEDADKVSQGQDDDQATSAEVEDADKVTEGQDNDQATSAKVEDDDKVTEGQDADKVTEGQDDDKVTEGQDDDKVAEGQDDDQATSAEVEDADKVTEGQDDDKVTEGQDDDQAKAAEVEDTEKVTEHQPSTSNAATSQDLTLTPAKIIEEQSQVSDAEQEEEVPTASSRQQFSPGPRTVVFRVPEFKWSDVHLRLLDDLFTCLEGDIDTWKTTKKPITEVVNSNDNIIFLHNTLHLISQMVDNVILACGGILPILSSATSPNYELDAIEASHGLSMESAWNILNRIASFVDILAFASTISFSEIENDKNMSSGGILRQCLRTACMCAVRNCLDSRYLRRSISVPSTPNFLTQSQNNKVKLEDDEIDSTDENVSAVEAAQILLSLMSNKATPILDPSMLLQDADVSRLRAAIYRDVDDSKQSQFLALAVVYFVSVLMVSKYRDILDPDSYKKLQQAIVAKRISPKKKKIESGAQMPKPKPRIPDVVEAPALTNGQYSPGPNEKATDEADDESKPETSKVTSTDVQDILRNLAKRLDDENDASALHERASPNAYPVQVTSIQSTYQTFDRSVVVQKQNETAGDAEKPSVSVTNEDGIPTTSDAVSTDVVATDAIMTNGEVDHDDLPQFDPATMNMADDEADVSSRLERSMDQLAPLLRDIFLDFSGYLSKTLVGSHGQELLVEGLVCMKSYTSVVELVMLLCSQEWQNSIQKNAGLAFIELINEGRLLCHGMKDHVVKVANEADFILSKQRAEDVKKHAQFESSNAVFLAQQREEERQCDSLITAAKHRDHAAAHALKNRITNILTNKLGAWGSAFKSRAEEYWMLDAWEDDTRRRRRFVRNPYGSSHQEATLVTNRDLSVVPDAATPGSVPRSPSNFSIQGADQLSANEDELLQDDIDQEELQGPVSFSTEADLISPGVCLHGIFSITPDEFFFEVMEQHPSYTKADPKILVYTDGVHGKWLFQEVRAVFSRRYLLQNTALEVFLANRTCIMFNFGDNDVMKKVVGYLPRVGIGTGYGLPQARRISLASPRQLLKSSNMTERWKRREISNFEYLMFLNTIAGRTCNDLNQYPVFPWILSNYDVTELDLSLPSNYRDLSKPIGALNPKRAAYFQSRYENWEDPTIPKFHYGTHYSNAAFTLGWLVRVEPFTTMFLNLQGGKFDHADRTFHSVLQSWKNCQRDSHDVKELIPEFFYLPEMFVNSNNYNLGTSSEGKKLSDVILPPWAKSADDFVQMNRLALESEIVSCQIHQWVDLIFGFKQRGPEAVRDTNVFYYLTYENSINLDQIKDPIERIGIREQIKNFGQTPCQLLSAPHPPRSSAMHMTPMMFKENESQDVIMVLKFQSNSPVVCVAAHTHPSLHHPAVVTCTKNLQFCINKWNQVPEMKASSTPSGVELEKPQILPIEPDPLMNATGNLCKRQISDMLDQSVKVHSACFVVTADNRYMVSCGYWDRSFRIITMETGKLNQVIFGHWDVVTCLTRSETYIGGDCYFVSGSRDATLMLWYWSGRRNLIVGDSSSTDENPTARAILTGHDTEITCAAVCAELGLIASGSLEGPILLHTITGDLLRSLEPDLPSNTGLPSPRPEIIVFTSEGMIIASYNEGLLCNFTMNGRTLKSKTIDDNVRAMLSNNNSQYLVTGGDKGVVQVWSAWDFEHLYTYPQCDAGIRAIAISHDQKTVITGMTSGSIVAFHINFNKWHYEYQNKF